MFSSRRFPEAVASQVAATTWTPACSIASRSGSRPTPRAACAGCRLPIARAGERERRDGTGMGGRLTLPLGVPPVGSRCYAATSAGGLDRRPLGTPHFQRGSAQLPRVAVAQSHCARSVLEPSSSTCFRVLEAVASLSAIVATCGRLCPLLPGGLALGRALKIPFGSNRVRVRLPPPAPFRSGLRGWLPPAPRVPTADRGRRGPTDATGGAAAWPHSGFGAHAPALSG